MLSCGIVGLPNVGKSTLFNAITKASVAAENYPFCTIDPNIGVVALPDNRLLQISKLIEPDKITPTTVEFVDIAGLVKGASCGEGLGNQFLSHIRQVDAIAHIVRCFEEKNVIHTCGAVDALRDVEIINTELILADISTLEKRFSRIEKRAHLGDKEVEEEYKVLLKIKNALNEGKTIFSLKLSYKEKAIIRDCFFLTAKPVLYVANVGEKEVSVPEKNLEYLKLKKRAEEDGEEIVAISAKIESEIAQLNDNETKDFLETIGLSESGLDRFIRKAYYLLNLITFFTAGKQEVKAWTIKSGTCAKEAAGEIHSDIERGFIRAEIVGYSDFIESKSMNAAKQKGQMRLEGKEYIIQDGDIIYFRFSV
ncbi:MAG: redox-regulated ATPase YchF [Candidatus Firestonebacteria bacterium]|nr:redox-regulated ATPase YchF [Candidatus Firestonebacteria bacterium]